MEKFSQSCDCFLFEMFAWYPVYIHFHFWKVDPEVSKMAESKGGIFAKQLQKHIVRTKTKVLQNLGKADKTRDDELDIHLINFQKQQHDAARLQKDLRHFINCARDLGEASTVLQTTMYELYEEEWTGYDRLQNINESLELLWLDYVQRLNASVLPSLVNYANLFPDSKTKISKRGRKLTDYDNTKHNLEAMLAAKKKDDGKILKAQDECNESKRIYDELNNELHDELPALYDKRIGVYASTFHTLFASTTTMYGESAKLVSQLADLLETLTSEHDRGDFMPKQSPRQRPPRPASAVKRTPSQNESGDSAPSDDGHVTTNDTGEQNGDKRLQEKRKSEESSSAKSKASTLDSKLADDDGSDQSLNDADVEDALQQLDMNLDVEDVIEDHVEPPKINNDEKTEEPEPEPEPRTEPNPKPEPRGEAKPVTKADEAEPEPETKPVEQAKDEKAETEDVPLPHGVLYQVRVSHRYDKQEEDELQLEPGDILNVVQIEEEGWLLGYQVETKEEGVFPENFTKRK